MKKRLPGPTIRFRVDLGNGCSVGIGKIELLERIAGSGSLSEAARQMRMSYRRAWLLLADMNARFEEPVARASTGGRGGGGATLTEFGASVVSSYRSMEADLQSITRAHFGALANRVKMLRTTSRKARSPATSPRRAKT